MNKKVLIVDDSTFMRMVLNDIISSQLPNLTVIEANGETEALEVLRSEAPDIVLLDIVMNSSEIEGLRVLQAIHDQYPKIIVIMVTSIGHASIKKQCEQLGAKGYIQKPFDRDEIKTQIEKYL